MSTAAFRATKKLPVFGSAFAQRRALLIDYDGTIAPLIVDRANARPYEAIPELLDEISSKCKTLVSIVTGREAYDIPFLLKTKHRIEVWGCHGLERIKQDGTYWRATLDREAEQSIKVSADKLRNAGFAGRVETKPGCVAIHWRGLTPRYSEEVKAAAYRCFAPSAGVHGLWIQEFDHGVELRVRACNKSKVVETTLSELGRDAVVAYLGDDTTDEDAFRALHGKGITILVRPTYRFTAAQFWLRPPDEVIWFLRDWIQACNETDDEFTLQAKRGEA